MGVEVWILHVLEGVGDGRSGTQVQETDRPSLATAPPALLGQAEGLRERDGIKDNSSWGFLVR